MSKKVDVFVVGAGPIGLACGIEAQKAGLSHVICDKGVLVNSIYHYPANMTFFSTSEKLEIGGIPFISHNPKPTRNEALEYYRRVAGSKKLNIELYNAVKSIEREERGYCIETEKGNYTAKYVILATGFYDVPHKLNVPGEDLKKVKHYYDEPHPYYNQNLVVVGASNSAVDAALECYRKGANVTMVVRGSNIGDRVKYWVKPDIENRIAEGSIDAYFNSQIVEIEQSHVVLDTPEGEVKPDNDYVLALTGYEPDFSFLKKIGLKWGDDERKIPVHDSGTMETHRDGLFLAGVICGGMETHKWFIENSRIHAEIILKEITKRENK